MNKKLKFGGISFGGKKPYVRIYGRKYKLFFGRDKKEKQYGYKVEKKKKKDFFLKYFYFLFPLYDLFVFFVLNPPKAVTTATKPIVDTVSDIGESVGGFYIPSWGIILLMFLYAFTMYYMLYLVLFKGVRTWHGTEHKVISAAEEDNLKNAKKYNPIHERCGGTLLPTMLFGYFVFIAFFFLTGIPYGEMTFITLLLFLNIKYFHKYDKFGIWFGKKFQKYISISEPTDWQLKLGVKGMNELVKAEKGQKFNVSDIVYLEKDLNLKKKKRLRSYIPSAIILFLTAMIIFSIVSIPPLATMNYVTDKNLSFSGLPGETKTDYVVIQINTTEKTLPIDKIKIWGLFDPIENVTLNSTIYNNISLYISTDNNTFFINETDYYETPKYWYITKENYSFIPIDKITILNLTFSFKLPEGEYNESRIFNYTPIIRFTSYI